MWYWWFSLKIGRFLWQIGRLLLEIGRLLLEIGRLLLKIRRLLSKMQKVSSEEAFRRCGKLLKKPSASSEEAVRTYVGTYAFLNKAETIKLTFLLWSNACYSNACYSNKEAEGAYALQVLGRVPLTSSDLVCTNCWLIISWLLNSLEGPCYSQNEHELMLFVASFQNAN